MGVGKKWFRRKLSRLSNGTNCLDTMRRVELPQESNRLQDFPADSGRPQMGNPKPGAFHRLEDCQGLEVWGGAVHPSRPIVAVPTNTAPASTTRLAAVIFPNIRAVGLR